MIEWELGAIIVLLLWFAVANYGESKFLGREQEKRDLEMRSQWYKLMEKLDSIRNRLPPSL